MSEKQIRIMPNGPYLVHGDVPLRSKQQITSEHGEPLTWRTGDTQETNVPYALCRCGGSDNKPFCDGTHARQDFDGTETAPTDAYASRASRLGGTNITVFDDRGICQHAGFCGNKASNIWKMVGDTEDSVVRGQVMAMIERCPSGALTFEVDGAALEPDLPVEVAATENGPLWVTGSVPVERSDGESFETRPRVTLCRCGESKNKPLCDGTHNEIGFKS